MAIKKVTVIIPTLDRGEVLLNTLKDLLKQKYPDFEIVVVDQTDHPKKEVLELIETHKNKIKYLHLTKKGSSHARNVGVKNAVGEIVMFLDDDIRIKDLNFILYHIQNFEKNKKIGAVGGRVIDDFQAPARQYKNVGRLKFFGLKDVGHFESVFKTETDRLPGGNLSCYRSIYLAVGGFKEIYRGIAFLEEADFCFRVKRAGYKLIFEPKAAIWHLRCKSGGNRAKDIYELRYWIVCNYMVFALENYGWLVAMALVVRHFCWAVTSSLKRGDLKMFKVMTRGIIDGIRCYGENRKRIEENGYLIKE